MKLLNCTRFTIDPWRTCPASAARHYTPLPLLVVCALLASVYVCRSNEPRTAEMGPPGQSTAASAVAEVPFTLRDNLIILKARINGSTPLPVALVTGVPDSLVSKECAEQLRLPKRGGSWKARTVVGWDQRWSLRDVTFDLGGLHHSPRAVTAAGLPALDPPLAGALGGDLFERFVVEIDFGGKQLRFYDPKSYHYAGTGRTLPLRLRGGVPLIEAALPLSCQPSIRGEFLEAPTRGEFLINTGNPSTMRLYPQFVGARPGRNGATIGTANLTADARPARASVAFVPQLSVGPYSIENLHVMFSPPAPTAPSGAAGTIGTRILRCFNLVIDYPHRQLCLETNATFARVKSQGLTWDWSTSFLIYADGGFDLNLCGARLEATQPPYDRFVVMRVRRGSAADQAGLREGDVLLTLDDHPVALQSLEALMQSLGQDGRDCPLEVQRGDQRWKTKLTLNWLGLVESEQ